MAELQQVGGEKGLRHAKQLHISAVSHRELLRGDKDKSSFLVHPKRTIGPDCGFNHLEFNQREPRYPMVPIMSSAHAVLNGALLHCIVFLPHSLPSQPCMTSIPPSAPSLARLPWRESTGPWAFGDPCLCSPCSYSR